MDTSHHKSSQDRIHGAQFNYTVSAFWETARQMSVLLQKLLCMTAHHFTVSERSMCYCFCSFTSVCCGVFFKRPYLRSVRFFYPFVRYAFAFYCGHVCLLSLCFLLQKWRPSRSFFLPDISEVIRIDCLSSRIAHKMGWSHPHNYYFRSQLHCQDPTEKSLQFFITSLYFWICFT